MMVLVYQSSLRAYSVMDALSGLLKLCCLGGTLRIGHQAQCAQGFLHCRLPAVEVGCDIPVSESTEMMVLVYQSGVRTYIVVDIL